LKDIKEMNFLFRLSFMKLHDISNYIEGTQFIYFNARVEGTTTSVIYDCISKTSKIFSFFQNDLVYKEADQSPKFVFADKNGVYELINSADTRTRTTLVQHIENDNILPDMDKIDQLRKLNEDSNPVIFYYEFKDAE